MFYRFSNVLSFWTRRWCSAEKVYALGLLGSVLLALFIFRIFWSFIDKFIDIKPSWGLIQVLAGLIGVCYGLLWMAVLMKSVYFLKLGPVNNVINNTVSARFILPLSSNIYKIVSSVGSKIFIGS